MNNRPQHSPDYRPYAINFVGGLWLLFLLAVLAIHAPRYHDLSDTIASQPTYDVEIIRDEWGVPHIYGQTDADVAFGLAYAHAQDDFYTIQQTTAAARGELALHYGADAAPNDYMVHLLRLNDVLDARYETDISPEFRLVLDAYAHGLNAYAAKYPQEAFYGLFPLTGRDVAAGFVHKIPLFFGIDGTLGELFATERQRPVSGVNARQMPSAFLFPTAVNAYGSNVLAVAPSRTDFGQTMLAINSHQPWEGPVSWYEARLHSEEGWDVIGSLFPGQPMVAHGHTPDLGWGFTVNHPDLIDVFVLDINPDNPNQYRFDGEWLELERRDAPITVKIWGNLTWTVTEEVLWSVYGPTVRQPHGTYAIRYASMGELSYVEQFYRLNKATNLVEWQEAMRGGTLPMFNVGYADKAGNIYYLYNALLPLRAEGYNWREYLPGDRSETLWTEYLPFDELPQVLNPPAGFIQNANSTPFQTTLGAGNPDPANYAPTLGIESFMTNRALRALELFGENDALSVADFYDYKYDTAYHPESDVPRLVARLLADGSLTGEQERAGLAILAGWHGRVDPENRGAALAILTLLFINEAQATRPDVSLNPSRLTTAVVPDDVLRDSFRAALDHLMTHFGQLDPEWQSVNRLRRGDVDLGLGGGPDILHATYGLPDPDGRLRGFNGDSHIQIVIWDPAGEVRSVAVHPYGSATLDSSSPHYNDQSPLFAARQLRPVWLDEDEVRRRATAVYRPGEE